MFSTSEKFFKGEKIRAARRRRKELRRLEQIRRKEWRLAHQNPETGDYDEYGAFPGLAELESVDKKQARKQRRHKRKQNSEKKKKTKQQNNKKGSKASKDRGTFSRNEFKMNLPYPHVYLLELIFLTHTSELSNLRGQH
jgi:hypothetical protein